jgi:hypothetical protein
VTTLHNARSGHPEDIVDHDYAATYGKLAYRSGHPFDVPVATAATAGSDDALVALEDGMGFGETRIAHRNESLRGHAGPGWIRSAYRLPTAAPTTARTVVLVLGAVEVRLSAVRAAGRIRLRDGGPVLGGSLTAADPEASAATPSPVAVVATGDSAIAIRGLVGFDGAGTTPSSPDRLNLVHDGGLHPWVEETVARPGSRLVASAIVVARPDAPGIGALAAVRLERIGPASVGVWAAEPSVIALVHLGRSDADAAVVGQRRFRGRLEVAIVAEDDSAFRGERILAIDGVARLVRPGILAIARTDGGVDATLAAGIAVDAGWAGRRLRWARFGDGAWPFGDPVRLVETGVVPDAVVQRARRSAGTSLVTVRLEA